MKSAISLLDYVHVYPARAKEGNPIRGYANVSIADGAITIFGIKILKSNRQDSDHYVVMPEYRIREKKYRPVNIKDKELREEIFRQVLVKFNKQEFSPTREMRETNKGVS